MSRLKQSKMILMDENNVKLLIIFYKLVKNTQRQVKNKLGHVAQNSSLPFPKNMKLNLCYCWSITPNTVGRYMLGLFANPVEWCCVETSQTLSYVQMETQTLNIVGPACWEL